jgi:hypothetical protein
VFLRFYCSHFCFSLSVFCFLLLRCQFSSPHQSVSPHFIARTQLAGLSFCNNCYNGTFTSKSGAALCDLCPQGTFSNLGQSVCSDCAPGTAQKARGAMSCDLCDYG